MLVFSNIISCSVTVQALQFLK